MLLKWIEEVHAFTAGDETKIREVLHPKNETLDLPYSLAHASLEPGERSLPHRLRSSAEVYVILEGRGMVICDGEQREVGPGAVVLIPAGAEQYAINSGQVTFRFLCIVSPPWSEDDEVVD